MTGDGGYWYPLSTAEFFVQFINDTPDVQGNQVTVSFTSNMPLASATCRTQPSREEDCKHMCSCKHAMCTLATIAMSTFIHSLTPDHHHLSSLNITFTGINQTAVFADLPPRRRRPYDLSITATSISGQSATIIRQFHTSERLDYLNCINEAWYSTVLCTCI